MRERGGVRFRLASGSYEMYEIISSLFGITVGHDEMPLLFATKTVDNGAKSCFVATTKLCAI
jgi:hypothetical protein